MSFSSGAILKAGTIQGWGSSTPPDGWLICDGSAISRTLYADLFNAIGTTYGVGDGETTFNIPNGKIAIGTSAPVVGNGITLGLTNGTVTGGLSTAYDGYHSIVSGSGSYNTAVSSSSSAVTPQAGNWGITNDPIKSGMISDLTAATAASNAIIKY